jgi:hypothetical protein
MPLPPAGGEGRGEGVGGVLSVHPRQIIEGSRNLARKSRDLMLPELKRLWRNKVPNIENNLAYAAEIEKRMDLVMDCYLTGAAEMLKLLHGDSDAEPFEDVYDHEGRLRELLTDYGLLNPSNPLDSASTTAPEVA